MVIQFTVQELMYLIVGLLGISAGVLLLLVLWNIKKTVDVVRPLVENNRDAIHKTISTLPGIFSNLEQISGDVKETTGKMKISLPAVLHEVEGVASASKANIELAGQVMENVSAGISGTITAYNEDIPELIGYLHIFEEVLQILYRIFSPKNE